MSFHRTKLYLAAALAIAASFSCAFFAPHAALAQGTSAPATVAPRPTIASTALPTLPPASASLQIPYPAYGTPAPNVTASYADSTVPQTIGLREAILIAVARSPLLAQARASVDLSKASVALQRVPILPNLSAQGSISRSHRQPAGASGSSPTAGPAPTAPPTVTGTEFTSNSLSIQLRQLVFDGGKTYASIKAATSSEVAQVETFQRQLQTVAFNVATAYYNAIAAQRTTAVDQQIVNQDVVQENLVRAQFQAGQAAQVDVITAQLPTSQARLALVKQQGVEIGAQAALANSMGLDANTIVRPADDASSYQDIIATTGAIPAYDRAIEQAYLLRPDLQSAQKVVEASQYSLRSARLGHMPSVSGTMTQQSASTDAGGGTFRNAWSLGAVVSIPLYDGGQTNALVAQATANLNNTLAAYNTAKLGIQLNVKQALTTFISARAALDATQQEYTNAVTVYRATQAQYAAGVTTLPLLLNAQVQFSTALTDQVNAIYSLRQAEQSFLFAIGQNA